VFIGLISYPLYLWHWPLLSFVFIRAGGMPATPLRLTVLATSVVLAWLTYVVIERPIRFGARPRIAVPALVTVMSITCAAGAMIYAREGLIDRPVNRRDAARLVDYYDRLHKFGLQDVYRYQCDLMDFDKGELRASLDPSCTSPGRAHTVFLWGDSFAQALSLGIRENLPADTALAQVATSACRAQVEDFDLSVENRRCEKANLLAMDTITRLHPELVIVAQKDRHGATDWRALVSRVFALGVREIVVVGPFPLWQPSLPRIYAEHHMQDHAEYIGTGLELDVFETDRVMAAQVAGLAHVTFVSLLDQLCTDSSRRSAEPSKADHVCLARVPGEGPLDLMALDVGHLTPKASSYLGRMIWKPYLDRAIR
jgi:hypothetical protein